MESPSFTLIIPAAGIGKRMGSDTPKPYLMLKGKSVLEHTLSCFRGIDSLKQVIVSTSVSYHDQTSEILNRLFDEVETAVVEGGERRQDSIYNAFQEVSESIHYVAIHDAVRPFIRAGRITECLNATTGTGAAIIGVPVKDTIKQVDTEHIISHTPDRSALWQAQTPQIFRKDLYNQAYNYAIDHNVEVTDDASLFEAAGMDVRIVEGDRENLKLTYPVDFRIAEMLVDSINP
ncbi:MAG TPA: 2-C-methyl-D-erythritol 4-phosphate cytidylyltransferase [Balneolaceae bacterium]|nr:2-C-methyl-D-erythritol 4-phosphate cytidylyltransferase [Balneolaceae bacterium]